MASVDIGDNSYDAPVDQETAGIYLAADAQRADAWTAATSDQQGRAIVSAYRLLTRLSWADPAYVIDPDSPDDFIVEATCLLAGDIITNPEITSNGSTASNISSVKAGPAQVTFFKPDPGTPLPSAVWELLKGLLSAGSGSAAYPEAFGTDQCSRFDDTRYRVGRAFE
jgi:hypothetical protein